MAKLLSYLFHFQSQTRRPIAYNYLPKSRCQNLYDFDLTAYIFCIQIYYYLIYMDLLSHGSTSS